MAEIKSTLEMVLERAARMEQAATAPVAVDYSRDGMRIAAAYMNGSIDDLIAPLMAEPEDRQESIRYGMVQVLLRNVILPREDNQTEDGTKALQALVDLSGGSESVGAVCQELMQILGQYGQHKAQMTEQLEGALRNQLLQQQAMQGIQVEPEDVNVAFHPQYNQEMTKMLRDLNDQYIQAMDQRKDMILQAFAL